MKKVNLLVIFLLLMSVFLSAQTPLHRCGMLAQDEVNLKERLKINLQILSNNGANERGNILYVPVLFHKVGKSDSTGQVKDEHILSALCALNEDFLPHEIQFYLSPHPDFGLFNKTINNDDVFGNQSNQFLMNLKRHPNAVNIFIVKNAQLTLDQIGGEETPGYYAPNSDWIVVTKSTISDTYNRWLSHEMGHYLSLLHTFAGWEYSFDSIAYPGNWPYGPPNAELMDGSNCETVADFICDTPPDYSWGTQIANCIYTGGALDYNGVPIDPMENNMMSYFEFCTDYKFTLGQENAMKTDLNSSHRDYLDNNYVPQFDEIITPFSFAFSPNYNDSLPFYDEVTFTWDAVQGASYYHLEIDLTQGFSTPFYQSFILQTTSHFVTNLLKDKRYYWRIRPFNESYTCAEYKTGSFKTPIFSVNTQEISSLNNWNIQPNPVTNSEEIHINLEVKTAFEGKINLVDATGKVVFTQNTQTFFEGENKVLIPLTNISNGVYWVHLLTEKGFLTKKMVVLK
jgi:Secretion system C-terminal sorting domain